jgi:hypothetical protein
MARSGRRGRGGSSRGAKEDGAIRRRLRQMHKHDAALMILCAEGDGLRCRSAGEGEVLLFNV